MSTRCQIGFYNQGETDLNKWDALIYKHCDGYPESENGIIATISPILKQFDADRGLDDIEYASAWLVSKLKVDYLNIGISKDFHRDIDYYYAVYPDGTIKVYSPADDTNANQWKLIQTESINSEVK